MAQTIKRLPTMQETRVQSLGWEDLLEKEMATHSSILAWKFHGQWNLVGYSPWVAKSRTRLSDFISKDFHGGSDGKVSVYNEGDPGSIPGSGRSSGEGNGNPLQYYCLENPMDRGACRLQLSHPSHSSTHTSIHPTSQPSHCI